MEGALGSGSCGVGAPYAERVLVGLVALARPGCSRLMTGGISGPCSSRRAQEPITSAHVSHAARCVAPSGGGEHGHGWCMWRQSHHHSRLGMPATAARRSCRRLQVAPVQAHGVGHGEGRRVARAQARSSKSARSTGCSFHKSAAETGEKHLLDSRVRACTFTTGSGSSSGEAQSP